jgi:hypothetical protein
VLLITEQRGWDQFDFRWDRRWDRFLARLLASSLDRRLAAGSSPDSDRLLAIRAQTLVAPETREMLARSWERLLNADGRDRQPGDPRIPVCRDRIRAAEPDVPDMITSLLVPHPVPARGVAMVMSLLRDGTGPVYNPNCASNLGALVRRAVTELDPGIELDRSA